MSELGGNGTSGSNGFLTLGVAALGSCLLVLLVSLADYVAVGSLLIAGGLVFTLIVGSVLLYLYWVKPGPPRAASVERSTDDDDDEADEDADEAAYAEIERHAVMRAANPELEHSTIRKDADLERLLDGKPPKNPVVAAPGSEMAALEENIASIRKNLMGYKRKSKPLMWATLLHHLGDAQFAYGVEKAATGRFSDAVVGADNLKAAAESYRRSLQERTRQVAPADYALTQSRLGEVLLAISRREPEVQNLVDAVAALAEALTIMEPGSSEAKHTQSVLHVAEQMLEKRGTQEERPDDRFSDSQF